MNKKDIIENTVKDFLSNEKLFTALDITNVVKKTIPYIRHSEVKEEIKELYKFVIPNYDYTKTLIQVTLKDGTVANAFLYHPISDTFDLDNKYKNRSLANQSQPKPVVTQQTDKDEEKEASVLWGNLFNSNTPSLFPRY